MNGWYDPQNFLDILDHLILAFAGIGVVAIPSYFSARNHKEIKNTRAQVLQVRDSVVNGHGETPLRLDIDRVIESIDRLSHDVSAIRRELADEETRRRNHVAELRDEVHRKIAELTDRILGEFN